MITARFMNKWPCDFARMPWLHSIWHEQWCLVRALKLTVTLPWYHTPSPIAHNTTALHTTSPR